MTGIQALLFNKDYFTVRQANEFMSRNNFYKIKPYHITKKYIRARLLQPDYKKYYYRLGNIAKGVDCIFEFDK